MYLLLFFVTLSFVSYCASDKNEKSESGSAFETEYQWTFINFTWNNEEDHKNAVATKKYIPENNAMAGIKFYKNNFYIAMPRVRDGTPVTLGYISTENSTKINPRIKPFPNWEMNELGDCDHLESVQSMEVDKNGTMWVLDGFRIKNNQCPPKLILFDLNDDNKILQDFTFPEWICLSRGGFLNDIVIDDNDGDFAYITDNSPIDPGLIVYSREQNRAWKIRDASMFPEIDASNFVVGGLEFKALAPIDGIALSPNRNGSRFVFYCSLSGLNLYAIRTDILKSEETCLGGFWRYEVKKIGQKQAQSDGLVVDNKGDLYYGLLPLHGVGKWNIYKPFSTAEIVAQNNETMIWTDSFALDDKGFLYLLANNIHKFFDSDYKLEISDEVKFRILKLFTSSKSYLY
ncbi:MRJP domain containing protein [Asbolus verrucosus]|uniref:MRJP domain containing protein n=1 Tax=Asbolus verrucosus TaxID=1661398 RepID=A0A482VT52_ASBVE|nr:MRJP domain containing protein [Asbolus verrucosus]